jgi:hypothetical protein
VAARAFGKHGVLAQQLHAELEAVVGSPSLPTPMLPVATPFTRRFVVQHLGGGKAGEDLHAQRFGLFTQPLGDGAQADDVVAVVVQALRGTSQLGRAKSALFSLRNSTRRR